MFKYKSEVQPEKNFSFPRLIMLRYNKTVEVRVGWSEHDYVSIFHRTIQFSYFEIFKCE